jgi:beta-glucosidase
MFSSTDFLWATGIEDTFVPQGRTGMRALDEYELTQHYRQWKSDINRVAETGVRAVRWGIPWYRVQPGRNKWDWRWTDQVLEYLAGVKGITPILDLMHYGTPLWLDNSFINAHYPEWVAEYAQAVAARYKSLVQYYTPLNEPVLNANWCGRRAEWPPYLTGDDGFVKMILAIAKGIVLTVRALKAEQPDAIMVQVEALNRFWTRDRAYQPLVAHYHTEQYLCFDLTTGRVTEEHLLYKFLLAHGATEADLTWFREHAVTFDIFGANFYPWSYGYQAARKDGSLYRLPSRTPGRAIHDILANVYARYRLPIMVTETSSKGDVAARARWMDETLDAVYDLRRTGVPVIGYSWFPLFSLIDWLYRTGRRPLEDYVMHLGLYDCRFDERGLFRRYKTPLVERFQKYMREPVPPIANET